MFVGLPKLMIFGLTGAMAVILRILPKFGHLGTDYVTAIKLHP